MKQQMSIYEMIMKEREQAPLLPYSFQNPETAGREDTLYILMMDGIPFSQKEDIALECTQILRKVIQKEEAWPSDEWTEFLKKFPLRLFFIELRERLRTLIEEGFLAAQDVHRLGMELTRTSDNPEEVKLGIILLGFHAHDLTKQIFRTLGYHSDYTIYVAESLRHSHFKQNEFIFDLAQNTVGYGKLAALFLLKPMTEPQQKWFLREGVKSTFLSNVYVSVALQKADIRSYLYQTEITKENYNDMMYILAYREPGEEKAVSDEMLAFMGRVVENCAYTNTFIGEAALVMIWLQIIESWKQDYHLLDQQLDENDPLSPYWEERFHAYETIIRLIEVFLNKPKWKNLVLKEMASPRETDFLLVNTIQFLEMKPEMNAFLPVLMRNPLGLNLLDLFLVHHPETYFYDVCRYLEQLLTEDLFQLPLKFKEQEEIETGDLLKVNLWLERLLQSMIEKDLYDEEWCITALYYYQPKIRRLALQALKKYSDEWDLEEDIEAALEELFEKEQNKKNLRLLNQLLNADAEMEKEKRYLVVGNPVTQASPVDKKLMNTYIAGMRYHDLTIVEGLVKKGKILQLVREPENEQDQFAIAITLENGYLIGYVPRVDNRVLATLLDSEEVLYAYFEAEELEEDDATISIMLRKSNPSPIPEKAKIVDNIVQFPKK